MKNCAIKGKKQSILPILNGAGVKAAKGNPIKIKNVPNKNEYVIIGDINFIKSNYLP